ncbi:MAG TPA: hypothetical protein VGL20_09810 [Candidatus Dormibacteraeota bacterium]
MASDAPPPPNDDPVVWEPSNLKHLLRDNPERRVSKLQIDEVLADHDRTERWDEAHQSWEVRGRTLNGRKLTVAWVPHRNGRFPVHVRPSWR